ncbi:unnamed protein product [Moneuplotes crassus]|uniref:Uncharacterized protein n=1 Tax=Euplotes crassus TaxID=5936 RepID=A0AAD1UFC2_EUPCR|nr:unnamed protein product [Moneuplotes crassus]
MNYLFQNIEQQSQENLLFEDQVDYAQDPLYYDNVFAKTFGTPEQKENSQILSDWSCFGQANSDSVRDVIKKNIISFETFYSQRITNADELEVKNSTNVLNGKEVSSQHPATKDASNHAFLSDRELEVCLKVEKESSLERNFLISRENCIKGAKKRADMEVKKVSRRIKQFYKDLFKVQNPEIIKRRYINCDSQIILKSMKKILLTILPGGVVTDDLAYFTIGICGIKQPLELECTEETKNEIYNYLEATKRFSLTKFELCLNSTVLQTLCRGFISQNEGNLSDILQKTLEKASPST